MLNQPPISNPLFHDDWLQGRWVTNLGNSIVTLKPDLQMRFYLKRHHHRPIVETTLKPGETKYFKNFYVIATSDDQEEIRLNYDFDSYPKHTNTPTDLA